MVNGNASSLGGHHPCSTIQSYKCKYVVEVYVGMCGYRQSDHHANRVCNLSVCGTIQERTFSVLVVVFFPMNAL